MENIQVVLNGVPRVVVGVSGSKAGRAALSVAVHEAIARHAALHMVRVWSDVAWLPSMTRDEASRLPASESADQQLFGSAVAAVRAMAPGLDVIPEFAAGELYSILPDRAKDASLLVVGKSDDSEDGYRDDAWFEQHVACPVQVVEANDSAAEPVLVV